MLYMWEQISHIRAQLSKVINKWIKINLKNKWYRLSFKRQVSLICRNVIFNLDLGNSCFYYQKMVNKIYQFSGHETNKFVFCCLLGQFLDNQLNAKLDYSYQDSIVSIGPRKWFTSGNKYIKKWPDYRNFKKLPIFYKVKAILEWGTQNSGYKLKRQGSLICRNVNSTSIWLDRTSVMIELSPSSYPHPLLMISDQTRGKA